MNEEARQALETAVKMEQDSIEFYTKAAEKTGTEIGRSMFRSLIKDEERHLKALRTVLAQTAPSEVIDDVLPSRGRSFASEVRTVFSEATKEIDARIPGDAGDIEALKIAIELEKEGYSFYGTARANTDDELTQNIYLVLQGEENEHVSYLMNTLNFLENSGDWYLWEEKDMIDGG